MALLVAEAAARGVNDRLPDPLEWHSHEAQKKVEQMERLGARGGADVVFVGTSMMNAAVDPALVEAAVGEGVVAYNASLGSGTPGLSEPWTLDVVIPNLRPRLVVVGVSSFEFHGGRAGPDAFRDAYLASPGAIRAGDRESVLDAADAFLDQRSELWRHRAELRDPAALWDALRDQRPAVAPDVAAIHENGYQSYLNTMQFNPSGGRLNVSTWSLGGDDIGALARLVTGLREQDIEVVLVDLPVTDEYVARHPKGQADYANYLGALRALGAEVDATVLEYNSLRGHEFFADRVHLNLNGMRAFVPMLLEGLQSTGALDELR